MKLLIFLPLTIPYILNTHTFQVGHTHQIRLNLTDDSTVFPDYYRFATFWKSATKDLTFEEVVKGTKESKRMDQYHHRRNTTLGKMADVIVPPKVFKLALETALRHLNRTKS